MKKVTTETTTAVPSEEDPFSVMETETTETCFLNKFFSRKFCKNDKELDSYESTSRLTNWWIGFERFPLFEHSNRKEKKSGGKRKNTTKTHG